MQRQSRCCNPPPVPATWIQGVPEGISPLKRKGKTPVERISLPTPPLLTYLVGNNHLLLSRLPPPTRRRTRTTKEVLSTVVDEDGDEAKTLLQQVLTLFLRRKKKTSPMLNASTAEGRAISPINVLRRKSRSQKTSDSLDNLRVDGLTWTVTLSPSEKKSVSALLDSRSEINANGLARQVRNKEESESMRF